MRKKEIEGKNSFKGKKNNTLDNHKQQMKLNNYS